jgi:hypothetical protein
MNNPTWSSRLLRWSLPLALVLMGGCAARHGANLVTDVSDSRPLTPTIFTVSDAPEGHADHPSQPPPRPHPRLPPPRHHASRPVTLAFVGDILMGGSALPKLKRDGPDSFFVHVKDLLAQADVCVGNLEGPLGSGGEVYVDKQYTFLTPPRSRTRSPPRRLQDIDPRQQPRDGLRTRGPGLHPCRTRRPRIEAFRRRQGRGDRPTTRDRRSSRTDASRSFHIPSPTRASSGREQRSQGRLKGMDTTSAPT